MTPDQNNEQQEKPQADNAPATEAQVEPAANAPVQDNAYQQQQQQQQQQPAPKPPVFSPWYNLDGTPREKNPNAPWWANPYTWRSDEEKAQEMAAFQKAQQEYEQYMQNQSAQQGAPGNFGQGQAWQQNAAQPGVPQGQTAQQPVAPASAEPQQSAVPTPAQPQQPAQPEVPAAPSASADPAVPEAPAAPTAPATPAAPATPEGNAAQQPAAPAVQQPAQSEAPTASAAPAVQQQPAAPVAPEGQPVPAQPQAQIPLAGTQAPAPQDPAQQPSVAPGQPGYQGQPQQPGQQQAPGQPGQPAAGQQPNPNQQAQGPFGQTPWGTTPNGKWDPNDPNVKNFFGNNLDPNRSLTLGARVPWFVLGFIGGIFGILAVWFMTGFWPEKLRKQAFWATWIGFAVQAVVVITLMNTGVLGGGMTGGTSLFGGGGSSSGNTSAFG